jgi:hypothetical protein
MGAQTAEKDLGADPEVLVPGVAALLEGLAARDAPEPGFKAAPTGSGGGGRFVWYRHLRRFDSSRVPKIGMCSYVERLKNLAFSDTSFVTALIYMERLLDADASFAVTSVNMHRLFLVCSMVAEKFSNDFFYKNDYYAAVGGIRLAELDGLEIILLNALSWKLQVQPEEYDKKRLEVMAQGSSPTVSTAASDEWDHDWVVVKPGVSSKDPLTPTSTASGGSILSISTTPSTPGSPESSYEDHGVVMYRSASDTT